MEDSRESSVEPSVNATDFDFQQHNVKLVQESRRGKPHTQLVLSDKTGTVSLMLDVKAASSDAVQAAAKAMAPLLSSSFYLILSEMEREQSESSWNEFCNEMSCPELMPLFAKAKMPLPQTSSSREVSSGVMPSPTASNGFLPPPIVARSSTQSSSTLQGVPEGEHEGDDLERTTSMGGEDRYTTVEELVPNEDNTLSAKFTSMAESGVDLNEPMKGDITPLLLATQVSDVDAVRVCLERGANPSLANASGITPVLHAVQHGAVDVLQLFMAAGAKPNDKAEDGTTPLHVAAESGQEGCLQVLLEWGADVDMKASEGATAALFAVQSNSRDCLRRLLDAGADPNLPTVDQWTPMLLAVQACCNVALDFALTLASAPRPRGKPYAPRSQPCAPTLDP